MDSVKLGKFLAELRTERKLTQEKLSEMLGIDKRKVSRWETGSSLPELDYIIKLAEILNVSVYELTIGQKLPYESLRQKASKKFKSIKDYKLWKVKRVILIILGIILGIFFGLTSIFTIDNYNTVQVYTLKSLDDNFRISGSYTKAKDYNVFNVTSLGYTGEEESKLNIKVHDIQYNILKKVHKVFHFAQIKPKFPEKELVNLLEKINNISFSKENSVYEIDENDDLIFQINYYNSKNEYQNIDFEFKLIKNFANTL